MAPVRGPRALLALCSLALLSAAAARQTPEAHRSGARALHTEGPAEPDAGAATGSLSQAQPQDGWRPPHPATFRDTAILAVVCMACCAGLWKVLARIVVALQPPLPLGAADASAQGPQAGRMPALDGLRAVFMLHVLLFHQKIWAQGLEYTPREWTWLIVPQGVADLVYAEVPYGAMQFCFALSGFNLYAQMVRRNDGALMFALKRWARITPLYHTALLWMLVVSTILPHMREPLGAWVVDVFYAQGLFPVRDSIGAYPKTHDWFLYGNVGPCWFLSALMICSCAVPLLRQALARAGPKFTALLLAGAVVGPTRVGFHLFANPDGNFLYTSTVTRFGEFLAGVLTAHLCTQLREWHPKLVHLLSNGVLFDLSLALAALAGWYSHGKVREWDRGEDVLMTGPFCLAILAAWAAAQQAAEAKAARARDDAPGGWWGVPGLLPGLLSAKPMVMFGDYSYSAFLFQYPVTMTSGLLLHDTGFLQDLWFVPILMAWVVGITLTHCVQEPLMHFATRDFKGPTKPAALPSPAALASRARDVPEGEGPWCPQQWGQQVRGLLNKPGAQQGKV